MSPNCLGHGHHRGVAAAPRAVWAHSHLLSVLLHLTRPLVHCIMTFPTRMRMRRVRQRRDTAHKKLMDGLLRAAYSVVDLCVCVGVIQAAV